MHRVVRMGVMEGRQRLASIIDGHCQWNSAARGQVAEGCLLEQLQSRVGLSSWPESRERSVNFARNWPDGEHDRMWLLSLGERCWFTHALSSSPGHVPTHEESCFAEGNVAAVSPTSAMICCRRIYA